MSFDKNNLNKKHLCETDLIEKSLKSQWRQTKTRVIVLTLTCPYNPSHLYYESFNLIYIK